MEDSTKSETVSSGSTKSEMVSSGSTKSEMVSSESEKEASNKRLANHFRKAILTTLDKFLISFSFNMFKPFYPEVYAKNPLHLKDVHQQFIEQVKTSITDDLNELALEYKVVSSLKNLDTVIHRYEHLQKPAWRPSGDPREDFRDHKYALQLKHKKRLEEMLEELRAENKSLEDTVLENNKVIWNLKKEIDDRNSQINNGMECLETSKLQTLEEELHDICEME